MNWDEVKIIYKCSSLTERLIVENILIKESITMNLNDGMHRLDPYITDKLMNDIKVCKVFNS